MRGVCENQGICWSVLIASPPDYATPPFLQNIARFSTLFHKELFVCGVLVRERLLIPIFDILIDQLNR